MPFTSTRPRPASDGGLLLLRQLDDQLGITRSLAAHMADRRDRARTKHDRVEQLRQRVYQIAMGYQDCNDADRLRHDPMLKTCENFIKDFKNALAADRLSCSRYLANCFRLRLHAAAYRLMHGLRQAVRTAAPSLATAQIDGKFDTLRLRLLKVAAHVVQSVRRILVRLPRSFPLADAFLAIAMALVPSPAPS